MSTVTSTATPATPRTTVVRQESVVTTPAARRALAVLRLAVGFVFLWAFLDKAFGLGYATPAERAWVAGGEPSQGFLRSDGVQGPARDVLAGIASPATDWLFMLGMLAVGTAVLLGIGLRVAAVAGTTIMAMLWIATWPPTAGSNNPVVDTHLIDALALVVLALTLAGDTWGLGGRWAALPAVQRWSWLR
jgi:thiosulfate dehydrogenase (quinone) large subunit